MLYLSRRIVKLKQHLCFRIPSFVRKLQLVKTAFCVLSNAMAPYFSQKLTLLSSVINSYIVSLPFFRSSMETSTNEANSLFPLYISPVLRQRHAGIAIDVKPGHNPKACAQNSPRPELNRYLSKIWQWPETRDEKATMASISAASRMLPCDYPCMFATSDSLLHSCKA